MIIIGEKINGSRKLVARAIAERDAATIEKLAVQQSAAGADWLDLNAGTHPSQEADDLLWLIEVVQAVVDAPLCLDIANPKALSAALNATLKTPMINSVSGEPERLENILPLVSKFDCQVIALAMSDKGIPETKDARMAIIRKVMGAITEYDIPHDRVYIDPLVMTISTNTDSGVITLETIRSIREEYPESHVTMGLSNLSFGLPARSYVNRSLLTLALGAGLDSAILDPTDRELMASLRAAELVLGRDRHCLNYIRAYRKGILSG